MRSTSTRRAARLLAPTLALALLATGCGSDGSDELGSTASDADDDTSNDQEDAAISGTATMPQVSDDLDAKPTIELADESDRPTTTQTEDVVVGEGDEATSGSMVEVKYVGVLATDGTEFDASWNRDATFPFQLDTGAVIPGWDQGVQGMQVGGRRTLYIPAAEGYGPTGSGPIPPDTDLIFVVDLVSVTAAPDPVTKADEPDVEVPETAPTELVVEDLVVGDGDEVVVGSDVQVHYVGKALSTGEIFDSSYDRGQPLPFTAGLGQLIPGFDEGMIGARVGGRRRLVIPPDLGYGADGAGSAIGPDETLIFVVDVVSVS